MHRSGAKIRVIVRNEQPTLISSDLIPTTGSIGAAATALSADTATTASFAFTSSLSEDSVSASFADKALDANTATSASLADNAANADNAISASFAITSSFTTGLVESASFADNATSALFATTSSFLTGVAETASFAITASFLTGKAESASFADSASFAVTASNTDFASTASFLLGSIQSASVAALANTASYVAGGNVDGAVALADTASYVAGANVDGIVASATSASGVAYDDVTAKPTVVSESAQINHNATTNFESDEHFVQSAIVEVGTVVTGDVAGILPAGSVSSSAQINTGSFSGSFFGDGSGLLGVNAETASYVAGANVDGAVSLADTSSYVAGANVDGTVANATSAASASDVAYDDVRDKPTLVSESVQIDHDATTNFDSAEHFAQSAITEVGTVVTGDVSAILPPGSVSASAQINTGSFTGSFVGSGAGLEGVVSVSHAGNADAAVLAVSAVTALTASHVAGGNVFGAVDSLVGSSEATGTLTGSFLGGVNLTGESDMSGTTFAHQMAAVSGATGDFTISLDENQLQQYEISNSLEFLVEGGRIGGFYSVHFINQGGNVVTWPSTMKFHSGSAVTSSVASGTLDIYTIHKLPDGTYFTAILGQSIA